MAVFVRSCVLQDKKRADSSGQCARSLSVLPRKRIGTRCKPHSAHRYCKFSGKLNSCNLYVYVHNFRCPQKVQFNGMLKFVITRRGVISCENVKAFTVRSVSWFRSPRRLNRTSCRICDVTGGQFSDADWTLNGILRVICRAAVLHLPFPRDRLRL